MGSHHCPYSCWGQQLLDLVLFLCSLLSHPSNTSVTLWFTLLNRLPWGFLEPQDTWATAACSAAHQRAVQRVREHVVSVSAMLTQQQGWEAVDAAGLQALALMGRLRCRLARLEALLRCRVQLQQRLADMQVC